MKAATAAFLAAALLGASPGPEPGDPRGYIPGETYPGWEGYVSYRAGDLPIILSAPHGGALLPAGIPDRKEAVLLNDYLSQELTWGLAEAIHTLTGGYPHVIVNNLHRSKLDPNRSLASGAQGDPAAERAWREYHAFIDIAEEAVVRDYGRGHYFDIHTNGGPVRQIELGFGLPAADFRLPEEELDGRTYVFRSNVRTLALETNVDLVEILRGPESLGGLLEALGYFAVPSPSRPYPDESSYFDGGYSVYLHGSRAGGRVDATQIEIPYDFLSGRARPVHVARWAQAIVTFMETFYGVDLHREGEAGGRARQLPVRTKFKSLPR